MLEKNFKDLVLDHLKKNQKFLLDPNFCQMHRFIINEAEMAVIEFALEKSNHSPSKAAKHLGIARSTLIRKIKIYKITK